MGQGWYRHVLRGILVAMGTVILSTLAFADTLSVNQKALIPTYQDERALIRAAYSGAASGLAVGAGVGYSMYQMLCNQGICPSATRTILPSLLIGTAVGASVGALVNHVLGHEGPVIAYPTVGIGTYGGAPAMMVEGRF